MHTAVKTKNSRINSFFALITLIELVRSVQWVQMSAMNQKNCFNEIELDEKRQRKFKKSYPEWDSNPRPLVYKHRAYTY